MRNARPSKTKRLFNVDAKEEMDAYDRLPPKVRERLQNASYLWSAVQVEQVINGNIPITIVHRDVIDDLGLMDFFK